MLRESCISFWQTVHSFLETGPAMHKGGNYGNELMVNMNYLPVKTAGGQWFLWPCVSCKMSDIHY